jgi:simple sugar transport system permease protein
MTTTQNNPSTKTRLATLLRKTRLEGQTALLLGVFIVLVIFFGINGNNFLTARSITSMGFQLPELGVLALAMMFPIITGGINLSVNASQNLAAVLAGLFLLRLVPEPVSSGQAWLYILIAMLIALAVGLVCGVLNGFLIGRVGVPPLLATLATMTFFTGISTVLTGGKTVTGFPDPLSVIGSESLLGIPIPFIVFVLITILSYFLLYRTAFGFKTRLMGANPTAANFSGIDNPNILMKIYIISGIFSAVTGILVMGRTMSAAIEYGSTTYVLLTILISVLAGIIPGFGRMIDVFISVLILQIISTGFHGLLVGVRGSSFFKDFSWGILLILIFIINYYARRRKAQE